MSTGLLCQRKSLPFSFLLSVRHHHHNPVLFFSPPPSFNSTHSRCCGCCSIRFKKQVARLSGTQSFTDPLCDKTWWENKPTNIYPARVFITSYYKQNRSRGCASFSLVYRSSAAAAVVLGWQQRERGRPATSVGDYNIDVAPCVFYQCAAVITRRRCCRSSALCVRFYNNRRRNMSYMLFYPLTHRQTIRHWEALIGVRRIRCLWWYGILRRLDILLLLLQSVGETRLSILCPVIWEPRSPPWSNDRCCLAPRQGYMKFNQQQLQLQQTHFVDVPTWLRVSTQHFWLRPSNQCASSFLATVDSSPISRVPGD
jgi:hypothetical protein